MYIIKIVQRLNYHHLYLFWRVAREGHFSRAADSLRIAQSAVTSQIKQLESHLGRQLIDRSNKRKPLLTEDGAAVLEYADSIFEIGHELLNWAKIDSRTTGRIIRVGAISGLSRNFQYEFLKPLLQEAETRLEVISGDQDKLTRLLKEHALDLILSSHPVFSEGKINFHAHVLLSSPLVFVSAKKPKKKDLQLKEVLKSAALYLPGKNFEARPELDAFIERLKVPVKVAGFVDDIALLRLFAVQSGAVVAIPEMGIQNELRSGEVTVIEKAGRIEQRFYAITRDRRVPNELIASLISKMKKG